VEEGNAHVNAYGDVPTNTIEWGFKGCLDSRVLINYQV
jgi:hypothetical protein